MFRILRDRASPKARGPVYGAIAQLGERLHGMQEVAGSSPAGSTEMKLVEAR